MTSSLIRQQTLKMARAALEYCYDNFEFVRPNQPTVSLRKAMETYTDGSFETGEVVLESGGKGLAEFQVGGLWKLLVSLTDL